MSSLNFTTARVFLTTWQIGNCVGVARRRHRPHNSKIAIASRIIQQQRSPAKQRWLLVNSD